MSQETERALRAVPKAPSPMLTQERLTEVGWVLGKMDDAISAMNKLLDGEPKVQPPTDRFVAMNRIESELLRLRVDLESLFS